MPTIVSLLSFKPWWSPSELLKRVGVFIYIFYQFANFQSNPLFLYCIQLCIAVPIEMTNRTGKWGSLSTGHTGNKNMRPFKVMGNWGKISPKWKKTEVKTWQEFKTPPLCHSKLHIKKVWLHYSIVSSSLKYQQALYILEMWQVSGNPGIISTRNTLVFVFFGKLQKPFWNTFLPLKFP